MCRDRSVQHDMGELAAGGHSSPQSRVQTGRVRDACEAEECPVVVLNGNLKSASPNHEPSTATNCSARVGVATLFYYKCDAEPLPFHSTHQSVECLASH